MSEGVKNEDRQRLLDAYETAIENRSYAAAVSAAKAIAEMDGVAKPQGASQRTPKTLGELKALLVQIQGMVATAERAEAEQATLTSVKGGKS